MNASCPYSNSVPAQPTLATSGLQQRCGMHVRFQEQPPSLGPRRFFRQIFKVPQSAGI